MFVGYEICKVKVSKKRSNRDKTNKNLNTQQFTSTVSKRVLDVVTVSLSIKKIL